MAKEGKGGRAAKRSAKRSAREGEDKGKRSRDRKGTRGRRNAAGDGASRPAEGQRVRLARAQRVQPRVRGVKGAQRLRPRWRRERRRRVLSWVEGAATAAKRHTSGAATAAGSQGEPVQQLQAGEAWQARRSTTAPYTRVGIRWDARSGLVASRGDASEGWPPSASSSRRNRRARRAALGA